MQSRWPHFRPYFVQELRRQIGAVRPCDSSGLRIEINRAEYSYISKRFENRTVQLVLQVHLANGPITEFNLQEVVSDVAGLCEVKDRKG